MRWIEGDVWRSEDVKRTIVRLYHSGRKYGGCESACVES